MMITTIDIHIYRKIYAVKAISRMTDITYKTIANFVFNKITKK